MLSTEAVAQTLAAEEKTEGSIKVGRYFGLPEIGAICQGLNGPTTQWSLHHRLVADREGRGIHELVFAKRPQPIFVV